jgi:hypothetical protein
MRYKLGFNGSQPASSGNVVKCAHLCFGLDLLQTDPGFAEHLVGFSRNTVRLDRSRSFQLDVGGTVRQQIRI